MNLYGQLPTVLKRRKKKLKIMKVRDSEYLRMQLLTKYHRHCIIPLITCGINALKLKNFVSGFLYVKVNVVFFRVFWFLTQFTVSYLVKHILSLNINYLVSRPHKQNLELLYKYKWTRSTFENFINMKFIK